MAGGYRDQAPPAQHCDPHVAGHRIVQAAVPDQHRPHAGAAPAVIQLFQDGPVHLVEGPPEEIGRSFAPPVVQEHVLYRIHRRPGGYPAAVVPAHAVRQHRQESVRALADATGILLNLPVPHRHRPARL